MPPSLLSAAPTPTGCSNEVKPDSGASTKFFNTYQAECGAVTPCAEAAQAPSLNEGLRSARRPQEGPFVLVGRAGLEPAVDGFSVGFAARWTMPSTCGIAALGGRRLVLHLPLGLPGVALRLAAVGFHRI